MGRKQILLDMGTATVGSASTTNVTIPKPAGGEVYNSVILEISAPNPSSDQTFSWVFSTTNDSGTLVENCRGALVGSSTYTIPTYYGNQTNTKEVVMFPVFGGHNFRLAITQHTSAGNIAITYRVWATEQMCSGPVTQLHNIMSSPRTSFASVAFSYLIPPSHTPYVVRVLYTGSTAINGSSQCWDYAGGFQNRDTQWMYEPVRLTGRLYEFVHPGDGCPILLNSNNTPNATVFLSFIPQSNMGGS